ncbi:hypothetical protein PSAC2689_90352 [Paraburkholderia sacchari]
MLHYPAPQYRTSKRFAYLAIWCASAQINAIIRTSGIFETPNFGVAIAVFYQTFLLIQLLMFLSD